ncbi:MAG: metalloregulator ArsR/SmtB family transcription factor [Treponema sp.]|nr:metalloregulator ArsR/SmtB family transcription factor [Treponema sp.]
MKIDHRNTGDSSELCICAAIHRETTDRVLSIMPDSAVFLKLADLYKSFSDSTRLRILWALSNNRMCVCDLAVLLGMTKSAISHQLRSLRLANLVKFTKQGKIVWYSLADDHVKKIFKMGFEHIKE